MALSDLAFVFEFKDKTDPRLNGRIEKGAMSKIQWSHESRVSYDPRVAMHYHIAKSEEVLSTLPDDFIYLDIDRGMKKSAAERPLSMEEVEECIGKMITSQNNFPKQLVSELK